MLLDYVNLLPLFSVAAATLVGVGLAAVVSRQRNESHDTARRVLGLLLVGSVAGVISVTLFGSTWPAGPGHHANLVPFRFLPEVLGSAGHTLARAAVVANVLLFAPIGFFGQLLRRRCPLTIAAVALALSVAIEAVQFETGRVADVDDVILNGVGALLGALAAAMVTALLAGQSTADREHARSAGRTRYPPDGSQRL